MVQGQGEGKRTDRARASILEGARRRVEMEGWIAFTAMLALWVMTVANDRLRDMFRDMGRAIKRATKK